MIHTRNIPSCKVQEFSTELSAEGNAHARLLFEAAVFLAENDHIYISGSFWQSDVDDIIVYQLTYDNG